MTNSFLPDKVKTWPFHLLPKIHKPNYPKTYAISSVNCHKSRISESADHYLQPGEANLKSYVKDTTDFI